MTPAHKESPRTDLIDDEYFRLWEATDSRPKGEIVAIWEANTKQLDRMKAVCLAGNILGLADVTRFCDENGMPLPKWALRALAVDLWLRFTRKQQRREPTSRRGKRSPLQKYLADLRDFDRYEAVLECREHRHENHDPESNILLIEKLKGRDVFEQASILLRETRAKGTRIAIRNSYQRVLAAQKGNSFRYYRSLYLRYLRPEIGPVRRAIVELAGGRSSR